MKLKFLLQLLMLCLAFGTSSALATKHGNHNIINFNLDVKSEVNADLVNIALKINENFNNQDISKNEQSLVAIIAKYPQIKVRKSINSQPIYAKDNSIIRYQKFINYYLVLNKIDLLSEILEQVAKYSVVSNVSYDLSSQRQEQVVEKLTAEAIGKFKQQSNFIVKQFGAKKYHIKNIQLNEQITHLNQGGYVMYRSQRSNLMNANYDAKDASEIDLSVEIMLNLQASIKLKFKK